MRAALANAHHVAMIRQLKAGRVEPAARSGQDAIGAYLRLGATPGADRVKVAGGLWELSGQLTEAGLHAGSAMAAEAAVEVLTAAGPAGEPSAVLALRAALANAHHVAMIRQLKAGRVEPAARSGQDAIGAYLRLGATPGADRVKIGGFLRELSAQLSGAGLTEAAESAAHAADDLLP